MRNKRTSKSVGVIVNKAIQRRAEKKVGITGNQNVTITTAGTVINLSNNIAQGDDFFQRTGDKITIVNQLLKTRAVALIGSQTMRFILFSDRFNQGTTPSVTDVLQAGNFIATYSQLNVVQQKRFAIHRDWTLDCNFAGEAIKSHTVHMGEISIYYNGSTSVATSNGKNAMFLLVIGSAATGTYDFNWEATYIDV